MGILSPCSITKKRWRWIYWWLSSHNPNKPTKPMKSSSWNGWPGHSTAKAAITAASTLLSVNQNHSPKILQEWVGNRSSCGEIENVIRSVWTDYDLEKQRIVDWLSFQISPYLLLSSNLTVVLLTFSSLAFIWMAPLRVSISLLL